MIYVYILRLDTISLLEAIELKKTVKDRLIINGVSFKVYSGEIVGLLGPNGAGKTTSFYAVAGITPINSGDIVLDGLSIKKMPIHKRARLGIGYLPQEPSIFRKMTVAENILSILELKKLNKKQLSIELDRLLSILRIDHLANLNAVLLSGGERRRCEIARVLAINPRFILFDEPFAGVDPIAVCNIQEAICMLKNMGIGIIITDHNVRETLKICDRAYIVHNGKILADGLPNELIELSAVREVYLGDSFRLN